MTEPRIELFDLAYLVNMINMSLARPDETIELGKFENKKPKTNPFLYSLMDKEITTRGRFPLFQTEYGRGLFSGLLGLEREANIGHISVETGYSEVSNNYGGSYGTLQLRIKRPLRLKDGLVIPSCSVGLSQEMQEWEKPVQERNDYERCIGLWVRTDLSDVLPSEWFFGGRKAEDYGIRAEAQPAR